MKKHIIILIALIFCLSMGSSKAYAYGSEDWSGNFDDFDNIQDLIDELLENGVANFDDGDTHFSFNNDGSIDWDNSFYVSVDEILDQSGNWEYLPDYIQDYIENTIETASNGSSWSSDFNLKEIQIALQNFELNYVNVADRWSYTLANGEQILQIWDPNRNYMGSMTLEEARLYFELSRNEAQVTDQNNTSSSVDYWHPYTASDYNNDATIDDDDFHLWFDNYGYYFPTSTTISPGCYTEYVTTPIPIGLSNTWVDPNGVPSNLESMNYCDFPTNANLGITDYMKYSQPESELRELMRTLLSNGTLLGLASTAQDMMNKFLSVQGSQASTPEAVIFPNLSQDATNDPVFKTYSNTRRDEFKTRINQLAGNVSGLSATTVPTPVFNSTTDLLNGLTICVDNVYAIKIELTSFKYCPAEHKYVAKITYSMRDDYGLDANDVINHSDGGFKAWYTLQHYRCYHPFITSINTTITFPGTIQ